ncbi:unnamed protein product [Closterium sp. Yama58-4]|nr:unnamed protein product [Closterium sp. Yama58-4]
MRIHNVGPLPPPHDRNAVTVEVDHKFLEDWVVGGDKPSDFYIKVMAIGVKNTYIKNDGKTSPGKMLLFDAARSVAEMVMWPESTGSGRCDVRALNELLMGISIGDVYQVRRINASRKQPGWTLIGGLDMQLTWLHRCSFLVEDDEGLPLTLGDVPTAPLMNFFETNDDSRIPCVSVRLKAPTYEEPSGLPKLTASIHDSSLESVLVALGDAATRIDKCCKTYMDEHPDATDVPVYISNVYLKSALFTTTMLSDVAILDARRASEITDAPDTADPQDVGLVQLMSNVDTVVMTTKKEKIASLVAEIKDPLHTSRTVCKGGPGGFCPLTVYRSCRTREHSCSRHGSASITRIDNTTVTLVVHESVSFKNHAHGLVVQPSILTKVIPQLQMSTFLSLPSDQRQSLLDALQGRWLVKVHFGLEGGRIHKTIVDISSVPKSNVDTVNFDTSSTQPTATPTKRRFEQR